MTSKNPRNEAGGTPSQGTHQDAANTTPSSSDGNDEPERDQDQPDLDAFAARMGTDQLEDRGSPAARDDAGGGDDDGDDKRDWRAPVSTALGGLASGARSIGERLKGASDKLVSDHDTDVDLAALRERVSKVRTVMFTTVDERGTLSSRPLTVQQVSESGDVRFVVNRDADWVSPAMDAANVAFVDGSSTWISVAGRAVLENDSQLLDDLWNPLLDSFFPDGRANAVVLQVQADRWEYWTAPNKLSQLFEIAKAQVSDDPPDLGESGIVET